MDYFSAMVWANVTAHPARIIITSPKIRYLILIFARNRSRKQKYTPKTAIRKVKNAVIISIEHNIAPAGWMVKALKILPDAKAIAAVVIPHPGHGRS